MTSELPLTALLLAVSKCNIASLGFGTGDSIYESMILPAITEAQEEVILVTCFWARSTTLDGLNAALMGLSARALRANRTIKVRLCFSSSSLMQKLFHTPYMRGQRYPPSQWQSMLGLPRPEDLQGLDMQVKSVFLLPFSVMHPKFVLVDRRKVFLPSCNVSWEDWFEGCVEMSGHVTEQFREFWLRFWANEEHHAADLNPESPASTSDRLDQRSIRNLETPSAAGDHYSINPNSSSLLGFRRIDMDVPSIFLPSPHHRNPRLGLSLFWTPSPPQTPLNVYLLDLFANAQRNIYIQTPNLTSRPVLDALLTALKRGVRLDIITSDRLMILEQLVTAGTTTARCVRHLSKQHQNLLQSVDRANDDLERGLAVNDIGNLRIRYYRPRAEKSTNSGEPAQSHLKLTIVDDLVTVFGSGNMDRASWFTSQELGVAFIAADFAAQTKATLESAMEGRSIDA
jgi:phosphatidylserine/phosphatidylglycerophosphate/cardiolipin synthase-like enzyme